MSNAAADIDLLRRLITIATALSESRATQIGDASIRTLQSEVSTARSRVIDPDDEVIGYEATCLVECIAALAYARTDREPNRESRAICYVNALLGFMRMDLNRAERRAMA